ncbi:MAG: hypothetical protein AUK48_00935 [Oscillatoriales cyanobacterium CG2_30_44_21]|nr:MAG: hypothetical protein AUK48_00935 [Oscillatoriales cyanobacterium CG2_30_44_21]
MTHGSSDRRSWLVLQDLLVTARSRIGHIFSNIGGGCLEGQELSLAQQLELFAVEVSNSNVTEIVILPLFLLEGVHVKEDIPEQVAITALEHQDDNLGFRVTEHLGTSPQIPKLLIQNFANQLPDRQNRILIAHGSRRDGANQVVEDLAQQCDAIAAYWGVEPKIETQIEALLSQGIAEITVLPYFLTEGGITEAIAKKLQVYGDRVKIRQLAVPLSKAQIIDLSLEFV